MTENEARRYVADYLNGELKEEELLNMFELFKCPTCGYYDFNEESTKHIWDLGEYEESICEQCRTNEEE